tara:strand:- start:89 stop:544 length:456 start_codon:yes stop_codon:yes gene_type:complete
MLDVELGSSNIQKFKKANRIALFGNGGNLAVAQHMASDIFRHTGKFCFAPDSINTTALAGDVDWKKPWMRYAKNADLIIGISCRKNATISAALSTVEYPIQTILIAPEQHDTLATIVIPAKSYHEFECNAIWTIYMLMESIGVELPLLPHL